MSTSPWLTPTPSPTPTPRPNSSMSAELDPWAGMASNDLLRVSSSSNAAANHLRSRKTPSPAFGVASGSTTTKSVDRHPLRSPSPNSTSVRPSQPARRPSAVASEWKAIGSGLAGLFHGSSSSSDSSSYKWPADPVPSTSRIGGSDEAYKGHSADNRIESTLDRLEDWFGLKESRPSPVSAATGPARQRPPRIAVSSTPPATDRSEDVRVLIHPVAPTDTLPSLALHYGADIHVLRKSNKLWPGDPVQIRKIIYVPVDSCKHRPPNAEIKVLPSQGGAISATGSDVLNGLAFVPREEDDELSAAAMPLSLADLSMSNSQTTLTPIADPASDFLPDTNKSYTDGQPIETLSSLGRASSVNGSRQAYPASLVPSMRSAHAHPGRPSSRSASSVGGGSASASATSSSFVAPRGPIHVSKVPAEKLRFFANDRKSTGGSTGSSKPGPGDAEYDPGQTGIDDLLALRQHDTLPPAKPDPRLLNLPTNRPSLARQESVSNMSDMEEEEDWKPNTWHFGTSSVDKGKARSRASANGDSEVDASRTSLGHTNATERSNTGYAGWNDAPSTHTVIATAYDGGRAYNKRQAQKSHRLLYDLAAGLPANTGAASKWARPIQFGDSLPGAPPMTSGSVSKQTQSNAEDSSRPTRKSATVTRSFGRLLDDTIRGRISVEAALEGAFEGVRGSAQPSSASIRRPAPQRGQLQPVSRPPRDTVVQQESEASHSTQQEQRANGFEDPLSALNPPITGLSKRRIDWTRTSKTD